MAKKTKRGAATRRVTLRTKSKPRAKRTATGNMKAKAVRLLARLSAKVEAARDDVKGRAKVGSKALAKAGAKAKASARRTFRKVPARGSAAADQLARNKALVLAFYQKIIGEKDYEGARQYMGEEYKQHAPYAADGHAGISGWVRKFKEAFPQHRYEIKKVIAEGDLVVLHLHGMNGPNPHGESVVDMFRVRDGKVVEHWDVIQAIPENADNPNTMF